MFRKFSIECAKKSATTASRNAKNVYFNRLKPSIIEGAAMTKNAATSYLKMSAHGAAIGGGIGGAISTVGTVSVFLDLLLLDGNVMNGFNQVLGYWLFYAGGGALIGGAPVTLPLCLLLASQMSKVKGTVVEDEVNRPSYRG